MSDLAADVTAALAWFRSTEALARQLAEFRGYVLPTWRQRYFRHRDARVFILPDRLAVMLPKEGNHG